MLNESTFQGDDTYSFETVLLQSGKSTDHKGDEVDLTFDDVKQAYATLLKRSNLSIPLYERHFKDEVARLLKYRLGEEDGRLKIFSKGVVYDPKTYYDQFSQGFKYTSPELTVTYDDDKVVDVVIDAAAMTIRPGMNPEMTTNKKMYFDAPADQPITESKKIDWEAPLSNIESKVDEIINKMTTYKSETPTETPKTTAPQSFDVSQLSESIKSMISEEIKKASSPEEPEPPIIDQKTAESMSPDLLQKFAEQQAELEQAKQLNRKFIEEKERQQKQHYSDILQKCRDLGIDKPENMVASGDFSLDQKIAVLQTVMTQFAKTAQMDKPSEQQMSSENPSMTNEKDTIDTIMQKLKVNPTNKQFKDLLKKTDIFDENGTFIDQTPYDDRGYM